MYNLLQYIQGDLFSDKTSYLLHACNCQNTWGRGVAATFAKRFPEAYAHHRTLNASPGDAQIILADTQPVICLLTSFGYGRETDPPRTILQNTEKALYNLDIKLHSRDKIISIASPKINAGLFKVPWEDTEKLIEDFLKRNENITSWTVYYL